MLKLAVVRGLQQAVALGEEVRLHRPARARFDPHLDVVVGDIRGTLGKAQPVALPADALAIGDLLLAHDLGLVVLREVDGGDVAPLAAWPSSRCCGDRRMLALLVGSKNQRSLPFFSISLLV